MFKVTAETFAKDCAQPANIGPPPTSPGCPLKILFDHPRDVPI